MTQAAQLAQYGSNNVGLSFKNRIINGDFSIWQRGTSLTTASNQVYGFADRWLTNAGASTTWSRSTDVPIGFQYSVSCAGSTFNGINQRIESFNCIDLAGQSITVSFWAKQSSGSSSLNINLAHANSADNFSSVTTIVEAAISSSPSSSWTRYSYTTVMPAGVANGLQIILFCAASANTTLYTGVQLEKGSVATSFDYLPFSTELMLCQRYYLRYQLTGSFAFVGRTLDGNRVQLNFPLRNQMRTTPSLVSSGITAVNNVYFGTLIVSPNGTQTYDLTGHESQDIGGLLISGGGTYTGGQISTAQISGSIAYSAEL